MNTRKTNWFCLNIFCLLVFFLGGCEPNFDVESQSLPPDKMDYEGHWEATGMKLIITRDGMLSYEKLGEGGNTSINGPILEFEGDDIVVGVWKLTTTFEVQEPPHKEGDQWVMVVDDTKLYKKISKQEIQETPPSTGIET